MRSLHSADVDREQRAQSQRTHSDAVSARPSVLHRLSLGVAVRNFFKLDAYEGRLRHPWRALPSSDSRVQMYIMVSSCGRQPPGMILDRIYGNRRDVVRSRCRL